MAPAAQNSLTLALPLDRQIPIYFRCPISLDLMSDPVILCTGQTYDRSSIERWVGAGNATCPVTMQKLEDVTLIPNHTLRRLIQDWCVTNRVERIATPKQPADLDLIRSLMAELEIGSTKVAALRQLRSLAKEGEKNRSVMEEAGVVGVVLEALFEEENGAEALAEEALSTVVALAWKEEDRKRAAATPARLRRMSELVRGDSGSSMEARVNAAVVIEEVSESTEEEMRAKLAGTEGLIAGLVGLLREGSGGAGKEEAEEWRRRATKVAIKALFSLCLRKEAAEAAAEAGAAGSLVAALAEADKGDAERALAAIELLCSTQSGLSSLSASSSVPALLRFILHHVSARSAECAVSSLLALCTSSPSSLSLALLSGAPTHLLLLLQSHSTPRAKLKARSLLKLFRCSYHHHQHLDHHLELELDHHHDRNRFLFLSPHSGSLRADVVPF